MQNMNFNNNDDTATNNATNINNNKKLIKIGNYALGMTIGKGNSAVVKLAFHTLTKQKVAIKMFDKSGLDHEKQVRLRREIDSMKRLKHKNIIRLYEIMETNKLICLVTEYAGRGELYDHIIQKNRLSEREARPLFKQIVHAIRYCHSNQIVHRDVKVENVLLDYNFQVKLADFGFSSTFQPGELLDVYCGSPPYCAPELYLAKQYDGPKVDIWSLGVLLYVLVCGNLPFEARAFNALRSQVIAGSFKTPFYLSKDCIGLIKGMLTVDPSQRFSIDDITNHVWFQVHDASNYRLETILDSSLDHETSYDLTNNYSNDLTNMSKFEVESGVSSDLNEKVLCEIKDKYNLNVNDIIKSVQNNEFDSLAGIYHLIESKQTSKLNNNSSCMISNQNSSNNNNSLVKYNMANNKILSNDTNVIQKNSESIDLTPNGNSINNDTYLNSSENELKKASRFWKGTNINNNSFKLFDGNDHFAETSQVYSENLACASSYKVKQKALNENGTGNHKLDEAAKEEEDEEMPIEELGKDYLNRYNSIRRHTIGTNSDNNKLLEKSFTNILMKSTECLQMLNENDDDDDDDDDQNLNDSNVSLSRSEFENLNISYPNQANVANFSYNQPNQSNNKKLCSEETKNAYNTNKSLYSSYNRFQKIRHYKPSAIKHSNHSSTHTNQDLIYNNYTNRRASDGGSNISLYSQFYSLKNVQTNPNANTNNKNNSENIEINNYINNLNISQSRGSIKSGMPVISVSTSANTNNNSSEEEDANGNNGYGSNHNFKYQRKSISKSGRHEPYLDSTSNQQQLNINNNNANTNQSNQYLSNHYNLMYRMRPREKSFSGTGNSNAFMPSNSNNSSSNRFHRVSEPNPIELILANRHNLERIYNQSILNAAANSNLSLSKELQMLQQENMDESCNTTNTGDCCSSSSTSSSSSSYKLKNSANEFEQSPQQHETLLAMNQGSSPNTSVNMITPSLLLSSLANNGDLNNHKNESIDFLNFINNQNNNYPQQRLLNSNSNCNKPSDDHSNYLFNESNINSQQDLVAVENMNQVMLNSSSNLHMIQEEQNEHCVNGMLFSSTESSLSSSASTTPRLNRSILSIHEKLQQQQQQQQQQLNLINLNYEKNSNDFNNNLNVGTKIFSILNGTIIPATTSNNINVHSTSHNINHNNNNNNNNSNNDLSHQ